MAFGSQWQALAITWAVELPVLFAWLSAWPARRVLAAGLGASLATHPVAWWASSLLSPHDHTRGVWAIELCVWLAEALLLLLVLRVRAGRALAAAGTANLASFALGAWLWA